MRIRPRIAAVTLAIVLAATPLTFAACGDDEPDEMEAKEALCGDLERLQESVGDFAGSLSPTSSADDIRAARDDVSAAFDDVRESARDVADVKVDELETAWNEFTAATEGLSDQPISEALSTITTAAQDLAEAFTATITSLECE